ncbi:melanocortin receptor 4-like [Dendronephthya gigantea]|uniref:melanocortin receptor 4-like n=1 Tax=Dendronephthya gigantea TaxID=151771 RepID=UPI00106D6D57|nr:melanocortin receptor 4-like [Dendronephthya gigantea]
MNYSTLGGNTSINWSTQKPNTIMFVQIDMTVALVFSILDIVGIIVGSLANIVTIALVLIQSELRTTTDVFTSSLCVSDLLASVLFQPFVIRRLLARKPNQSYEWALRRTIGQATLVASSLSLLTAAVDRYIVLRWPLRHENIMQRSTALFVISGVWLVSFSMGVIAFFKRNVSAVVFPSIIAIIVATIVVIQLSIFIIAKKQVDKMKSQSRQAGEQGARFVTNMRATRTTALLLAVFLVSWLPSTIFRFYDRLSGGDMVTFHKWMHLLNTLIQIHCTLDPFLYVLRHRRLMTVIERVFKRRVDAGVMLENFASKTDLR